MEIRYLWIFDICKGQCGSQMGHQYVIILTYKMEKWLSDLQFLSMFTGAKWASMSIALASTLRALLITPACHFLVCGILRISELTLCKVSTNCASEDFSRPCSVVHKYVDFSFLLFFVSLFAGVGVCLFACFVQGNVLFAQLTKSPRKNTHWFAGHA